MVWLVLLGLSAFGGLVLFPEFGSKHLPAHNGLDGILKMSLVERFARNEPGLGI